MQKTIAFETEDSPDLAAAILEMKDYIFINKNNVTPDCKRRICYLISICYDFIGYKDSAETYLLNGRIAAAACNNDTAIAESFLHSADFYRRNGNKAAGKVLIDTAGFALKRYMAAIKSTLNIETAATIYTDADNPFGNQTNNTANFKKQFTGTQLFLLRLYHQIKGNYLFEESKGEEAKKNLLLAYQFSLANPSDSTEGNILNNIGLAITNEGRYKNAADFFLQALLFAEKRNDYAAMSSPLINLSYCYRKIKNYGQAELYAVKAVELAKKTQNQANFCRASSFLSRALSLQNKPEAAEAIMRTAIDTAIKYKLKNELAYNYRALAEIMVQHNYKLPEVRLITEKSRGILIEINDSSFLNATDITLGNYYLKTANYPFALQYTQQSILFSRQFNDYSEIDVAYKQLADIYLAMGNYKMAYTYLEKFNRVKDSLSGIEIKLSMQDLERKYNSSSKELQIAKLEKGTKEKELLISKKNNRINLFSGIALFTLLAALSFFYFNRKITRQKKQVDIANEKLKDLTGLQNRLFRIIAHDLKAMLLPFNRAGKILHNYFSKNDTQSASLYVNKLEENAVRLSATVNNLLFWSARQLEGYVLKKEITGIRENIIAVLEPFEELISLKKIEIVNLINEGDNLLIDKGALEIILRNIFSNAIKFTSAGAIHISGNKQTGGYTLQIKDEGTGMSDEKIQQLLTLPLQQSSSGTAGEKGSGIGFSIVKKLVELSEGKLFIESSPTQGTTVTVFFDKQ